MMMLKKKAKAILASLRITESLLLKRSSPARYLHSQVTQRSQTPPLSSSSSSPQEQTYNNTNYDFLDTHQKLYLFAMKGTQDLEKELEKSHPTFPHETVVYVLKKLDKNPLKALDFFNWVSDKRGFKPSLPVYSLILRILSTKETMLEFWDFINKMSDEGLDVDMETCWTIYIKLKGWKMRYAAAEWQRTLSMMYEESITNAMVEDVVDVVLESDWEKRLGEVEVSFTENVVLLIFMSIREDPLRGLCFFRWLEEHRGYIHNAVTYNGILRVLGREESIKEFWSMVKEMKSAGHDIDIDTYVKISRWFQRNNMMEDAVALYELMMDSPYKPSLVNCHSLLKYISWNDNPDLGLAFRVAEKYEITWKALSKYMYDGIVRSLSIVGRFDDVEKVLENMRSVGYEPDNFTYSKVVLGLCKAGRLEESRKVLKEMEGQGCVPDIKTWTILIQGNCNAGEINEALLCYSKILEKYSEVDGELLEVLVNALCSKRRVATAYALLTKTVEAPQVRPTQATYRVLIHKLLAERKLEEAKNLARLMKKQNLRPLTELFDDYVPKFGTTDDAVKLLN